MVAGSIFPPDRWRRKPSPPIALDGLRRDLKNLSGFQHAPASKEPEFDHLGLPRIDAGESGQRLIECDEVIAG
jgi:hypothetical protein